MTTHEFNNQSDQAERKRVIKDTYLARAEIEADEVGGRFKKQTPSVVIGSRGVPQYPQLPSTSPWAEPPPSGPDPLGFRIDDLGADDLGGSEAPTVVPSAVVETDPPILPKEAKP